MNYESTKVLELGSCAFRQWRASHSHCKFIHGYRLQAKFWFGCSTLDDRNWVVDFGGLKGLKQILEQQFDHTLCVAADDPLLEQFKALHASGAADLRIMNKGVGIERTAEWCFEKADTFVRAETNNRCWVNRVEVWEHEKNSAIVTKETIQEGITNAVALEGVKNFDVVQNTVPVANTVAAPAPEIQQAVSTGGLIDNTPLKNQIQGAPVGNKVTKGWSNLFAGTSWGT
jgi:6-pyruvoyltetrahydropterin/6-carboxytetrahydropterin synthase